ncbi:diacylglycerol kinase [Aquimarina sp. W85]|uniref:diacylglycerol kinase n=1 Tax=Aquimarina rhodophyticola TaxID=3342246 RepID=UPI00366C5644
MSKAFKFLSGRIRGGGYALKGAFLLLKTEASIQVQITIAVIMTILGIYFDISRVDWILQIFAIGLVLSIEGINTAIEAIADFIHPDFHNKIGFIKDIAAGAVFFAAFAAFLIGVIIYIPYFS